MGSRLHPPTNCGFTSYTSFNLGGSGTNKYGTKTLAEDNASTQQTLKWLCGCEIRLGTSFLILRLKDFLPYCNVSLCRVTPSRSTSTTTPRGDGMTEDGDMGS